MNRNDEIKNLDEEINNNIPLASSSIAYAVKKYQRYKKIKYSLMTITSCCITFVLLVNISNPVALALSKIPVINSIVELVKLDKSLQTAINNEYVQELNLSQTKNGVNITIDYAIVDEKNINVFYTTNLIEDAFSKIKVTGESSYLSVSSEKENGIRRVVLDNVNSNFDENIKLKFDIEYFKNKKHYEETFDFDIKIDQEKVAKTKIVDVNKEFIVSDQYFTVSKIEIYPTNTRLYIESNPNNTMTLSSLDYYLIDENNKKYNKPTNGIISSKITEEQIVVYRNESSYFEKSNKLTMVISEIKLLSKDNNKILVNLSKKTLDNSPEFIKLDSVQKIGNSWKVIFKSKYEIPNHVDRNIQNNYYDVEGNEYYIMRSDSGRCDNIEDVDYYCIGIYLDNYAYDEVYLMPTFNKKITFDKPLEIELK